MKGETIHFSKGRVDISDTPEMFPLGERGKRPVRFTLFEHDDFLTIREAKIPGVVAKGSRVDCAWDVATVIATLIGEPFLLDIALQNRLTCKYPTPGLVEYQAKFKEKLYDYQRESVRFLARRSYAVLGELPRTGKTAMVLATFALVGARRLLVLCNALGKYVWGEEVAKWLEDEAVLLFGRAGTKAHVYCKHCLGRGFIPDEGQDRERECKKCDGKGERIHIAQTLERVTEARVWNEITPEIEEKHRIKTVEWLKHCADVTEKHEAAYQVELEKWRKSTAAAEAREAKYQAELVEWGAHVDDLNEKHETAFQESLVKWQALVAAAAKREAEYQSKLDAWTKRRDDKLAKNPDAKVSKAPMPPARLAPPMPERSELKLPGMPKQPVRLAPAKPERSEPRLPAQPEPLKGHHRVEHIPVEPSLFRCPAHLEETDVVERACRPCKTELAKILENARVIVVNYDITTGHKMKDDAGSMTIREDLPGWGPTLASLNFDMAVGSEAHKLRGWHGKGAGGKDAQSRVERANEICAEIPRVYGETGTFIYGFTRDAWSQLDFISKGLFS